MNRILTCLAALAATLSAPVHAGDVERGREKSVVCQACHGPDGNGVGDPQYPVLAGQYADYLAHALRSYRTGERQNVIMQGFVATLSEQDIRDLAAFYAAQSGPLTDLRDLE